MEWIFILAALLPFVATISAKAGGAAFSNHEPRLWLAQQTGWRRRAHAAQQNTFEALPFFYAVMLFALYKGVEIPILLPWGYLWLALRLVYIWVYIKDWALLRSLIWALALATLMFIAFLS